MLASFDTGANFYYYLDLFKRYSETFKEVLDQFGRIYLLSY